MYRKLLVLCGVAAVAALFLGLGLHRYLSLATLKAQHAALVAGYEAQPLLFVAVFMAVQIVAVLLFFPGAVLSLALAAGAIFGLAWGTAIVLVAATIGHSLGFLAARHLFRDWVMQRLGPRLARFERGIERHGAYYLLSLRLMAMIPYAIVNLAMALTRMPLRSFAAVSFVGLAPATALYVNAGTQLAQLEAPGDVLSPALLGSLALLAAAPLAFRFLFRSHRDQA